MKSIGGNSVKVRRINSDLLRAALRRRERASIAELARDTGLSVATCANILPELVESGVAVEFERRESQGGRPARLYGFNAGHVHILGLVLRHARGAAWCGYEVFDAAGESVESGRERYGAFSLAALDATVARMLAAWPTLGVMCIGVPGVVHDGKVEACDIRKLSDVDLAAHCRKYGIGTLIDNDTNLAALGYRGDPPLPPDANLAYLVLPADKCPGCGLVVNGRLVHGASSFAGEVGYIPSGKNPRGDSVEAAGRLVATVAAVVNPHAAVLSGEMAEGLDAEAVRRVCRRWIPERHIPVVDVRPEYEGDCFAGMRRLGLDYLSGNLLLIEKEGLV